MPCPAAHGRYVDSGPAFVPCLALARTRTAVPSLKLPPAQDVETAALPDAGDWCFNIPLWGNPVLPNSETGAEEEGGAAPVAAPSRVPDPDFVLEDEENGDAATESIQAGCLPR